MRSSRGLFAAIGTALCGLLFVVELAHGADLLIRNARLIDGTGAPPRQGTNILVRNGRVAEVGPEVSSPEVADLDVDGATVLPGLIDAHVHLVVVPGSEFRKDPPEVLTELRRAHIRGYLAAGVTTILDTGIPPALAQEVRGWLASGHPGPNFFNLGPPFAVAGGYGKDWSSETVVSKPEQLDAAFSYIQSAGPIGTKVLVETGFGPGEGSWPTHSPEMRAEIAKGAAARALPIYVHASSEAEQRIGLEMGAHALVHMTFYAQPPSADFIQLVLQRRAYMMTTFSINDAELTRWHPERLDDPLVVLAVPELERRTARDPNSGWFEAETMVGFAAPALPRLLRRPIAWWFIGEKEYKAALASSMRAAKILHDAGVPLVIGSDAGNWPIIPYQFHATSTLREIELLVEAGVPAAAVLSAATSVPARMLGIEKDVGTIEVGKRADLIVVDGDPLADIHALRRIEFTIKDGVARRPKEWIQQSAPASQEPDMTGG